MGDVQNCEKEFKHVKKISRIITKQAKRMLDVQLDNYIFGCVGSGFSKECDVVKRDSFELVSSIPTIS